MSYPTLEVANFIIFHEKNLNRQITNLRLQKLMYFVQADFLFAGPPCFDDKIEAWDFGPVIPVVYNKYRKYNRYNLPASDNSNIFSDKDRQEIIEVLEHCKDKETWQLVAISQNQDPWNQAYRFGDKTEITNESIVQFFKTSLVEAGEV